MKQPHVLIYDSSAAIGGALTSLVHLLPNLLGRGWRVSIVTTCARCRDFLAGELALSSMGEDVALMTLDERAREYTRDARGVHYFAREMWRASKLARHISRARPDVIIANNAPQANGAVYLATQAGDNVPIIQYVRGAFYPSKLARHQLARAASVLAVGERQRDHVASLGREDVRVVGEGLRPDLWPSVNAPARGRGELRWLWASSLMPWKGSDFLARAYGMLERATPMDVCYLPVAGEALEGLEQHAQVTTHRALGAQALDAVRASASVYLHTSQQPEPFGRSILEAMAAGLCPVVPDEGSGPMLVEHGRSGLIYKARDMNAFLDALRYTQRHPEHVFKMGRRAMEEARFLGDPWRAFAPVTCAIEECLEAGHSSNNLTRNEAGHRVASERKKPTKPYVSLAFQGFSR